MIRKCLVCLFKPQAEEISANVDCSGNKETERAWNLKLFLAKSPKVKSILFNLLKKSQF